MSRTYTLFQFIAHTFRAKRWDAFHSPFLFSLFTHCCNEQIVDPAFAALESQRKQWIKSKELITRQDFGAGSSFRKNKEAVPVSTIARHALSLPFQCRFMYRLADFVHPERIVEFGTSLGISTCYLAAGANSAQIDTIEGDPEIAKRAENIFKALQLQNIRLHNTTFETYISNSSREEFKIDLLFLDGHHTAKALWHYYHALRDRFHPNTIILVDDIYWSKDMNAGWKKLAALPEVTQSVDCFHFGLLFFNPDFVNKENHIIHLPFSMLLS